MDNRKIQVFLATIRLGSFNKAAEELHMTQSAVTQSMNHFEDELGFIGDIIFSENRRFNLFDAGCALECGIPNGHIFCSFLFFILEYHLLT